MTYEAACAASLVLSAVVFGALLFLSAPYGRHERAGWGPHLGARLGWLLMELPAAATIAAWVMRGPARPGALVLLALWEVHYLYRALVYPWRLRGGRTMPLAVVAMGVLFNLMNGTLNGLALTRQGGAYTLDWLRAPAFLAGALLFLAGFAVHLRADAVLRRLRPPGESGYRVPHGGLYELVSCPNYLGELVEWIGWAIATWSLAGLTFAVWTAANLIPRALSHHRWYRARFPDYPPERRAILPFLL